MSVFQAIILGVLQGIAEFLPISSSGHLAVAQKLFGLSDVPLLFDVMLHLATLAAVILYFRKKIARLFVILFRWIGQNGKRKIENGEFNNSKGEVSPSLQPAAPSFATPSAGSNAARNARCDWENTEDAALVITDWLGREARIEFKVARKQVREL